MGFTDASIIAAAAVAVGFVVAAAASSCPAELSPITVAGVVLVLVGAMDGRAALTIPDRPP